MSLGWYVQAEIDVAWAKNPKGEREILVVGPDRERTAGAGSRARGAAARSRRGPRELFHPPELGRVVSAGPRVRDGAADYEETVAMEVLS